MKLTSVVIGLVTISLSYVGAQHMNLFDAIKGCRQHNTYTDYFGPVTYFPTDLLVNVVDTGSSKYFRLGVLSPSGGVLLYGAYSNPYLREVVEIAFDAWDTESTFGRLQTKLIPAGFVNNDLAVAHTPNLLSPFGPIMMVLKVARNGWVDVFLDGQRYPLLSFFDPTQTPANFMTFAKTEHDLVFFLDCPMRGFNLFELNTLHNTTGKR